jgi:hypothetical protein
MAVGNEAVQEVGAKEARSAGHQNGFRNHHASNCLPYCALTPTPTSLHLSTRKASRSR